MFGCPALTNLPPVVTAIPIDVLRSAGMPLAAWLLSGVAAGLVLVGAWYLPSACRPSRQAAEHAVPVDALDEAA